MDIRDRLLLGCLVAILVLAVPVAGGEVLLATSDSDDDEFEFVQCFGFSLDVTDSETNATHVTSDNLSVENASVRPTNETPPGHPDTFQITSDSLQADDVCFYERVGNETGSQMELLNITNENSTIFGPHLETSYDVGTADRLIIETELTVEDLISDLL